MGLALIGFNYRGITRIQGGTNTWHEGASRPGAAKQPAAAGYRRWCAQALLYKIHSAIILLQSLPLQTDAVAAEPGINIVYFILLHMLNL